jgi:hypothetical protein
MRRLLRKKAAVIEFPLGIASAIGVADNVIDQDICAEIVDYIEANQHLTYDGLTVGGVNRDVKRSTDTWLSAYNKTAEGDQKAQLATYNDVLFSHLSPLLSEYCSRFFHLQYWINRYDTGYQYQKYEKGSGRYLSHIDGAPFDTPPLNERVVAIILYLNDVERGGETWFDLHEYAVRPRAGRVAIFPTGFNYPHGGRIPLSGDKHIVSSFCYSPWDQRHADHYRDFMVGTA